MFAEVAVGYRTKRCYEAFTALCGLLILGGGTTMVAQAQPDNISDRAITMAAKQKLSNDHALVYDTITVRTNQGIVVLSGTADNLLTRDRATEDAQTIKGVLSVVNTITLKPVSRTDGQVRNDVMAVLLDDPATGAYPINVEVNQGVVLLTGQVGSWAGEQLATQVTKGVRGVKDVQNALWVSIRTRNLRSDDEIAADIRDRLELDVWLNPRLINIAVENGIVTLSGAVGSALERKHAYFDARVTGVRSVDDRDLAVKPSLRDQRLGRVYP